MAGEVQLKLQASLDLAFLKNQLSTIGTQLGGQPLNINVKLDRQKIASEYRLLQRYFGNKTFRASVETNLEAEIKNADRLVRALGRVQQAASSAKSSTPIGVTGFKKTQGQGGFTAAEIKTLFSAAIQGGLLDERTLGKTRDQMVAALGSIGRDAMAGLLNGLESKNADIRQAAETIGTTLIATTKSVLKIASPSKEFENIGRNVGEGFEKGALSSMDDAFDALENKIRQRAKVLDTLARGIFRMLGMDPAQLRAERQARLAPPVINWPAQVPQRNIPIGPSSTGRALPQSAIPGMLPGTSYVSQKRLVGDILSPSLKEALRGAANAFVDNVRRELNNAVRQVSVRDLGNAIRTAIAPSRVAGLLPPSVGREPRQYAMGGETREQMFARRTTEAYMRSAARGMDVMGGGGALPPGGGGRPPGGGGGDFRSQMGFGPAPRPVDMRVFQQARVPLAGAMRELASELGEATKQVLLFGTAYKGLAFFLNIPRQAFDAAKAFATYENQLRSVTSATNTFEQSSVFVENLAARFNVPLDSARQGFVRLFASMQPAGFGQGQIENLFTGIASATATFGLSADQVERVMNAFSQMASKGQIMAEELKGQLGDVLPGSLALFAEAAQMSIPEFTKAMENGAFKGKAMQQVLDNVAVLMNQKFGPAAQNASKTLQGTLNQIQNNLQLMYESLTPIVNDLASAFGPAINSLLKDTASAVKALTGTFVDSEGAVGALTPRAEALYLFFKNFGPSVAAAGSNLGSFVGSLQILIGPLSIAGKGLLDFISLPVVSRVALYATVLGALNGAFVLLARTGIASAIAAFVRFAVTLNIAQLNVYIAGIRSLVAVMGSLATGANVARFAITALKVSLVSLGVGVVLLALDAVAQRLLNIGSAAQSSRGSLRQFAQELDQIAVSGDAGAATEKFLEANTQLAIARRRYQEALKKQRDTSTGGIAGATGLEARQEIKAAYDAVLEATRRVDQARQTRQRLAEQGLKQSNTQQVQLQKIEESGEAKKIKEKKTNLEGYYSLEDQLAKALTQAEIDRLQRIHEHRVALMEEFYSQQEARANSFQKESIRLQRELSKIESERQGAMLRAQTEVMKAQGAVAGGPPVAAGMAGTGVVAYTGGATYQDPRTRGRSTGPHLHAQGAGLSEQQLRYLVDKYLIVGGRTASSYGQSRGARGHGYNAIDFLTPQQTPIKLAPGASISQYGPAGGRGGLMGKVSTPEGSFELGHLVSLVPTGAGAPRKVPGSERRELLAAQDEQIAKSQQVQINLQAEEIAYQRTQTAIENYLAAIFSPAEQELQNNLIAERTRLIASGADDAAIDAEMKRFEVQEKISSGIAIANAHIETNNNLVKQGLMTQEEANKRNAVQNAIIKQLTELQPKANKLLAEELALKKNQAFVERIKNLQHEIRLLRSINDEQARRIELEKEGVEEGRIQEVIDLEKIKANLEEARRIIDDFVAGTTNEYKDFIKAVINGESAKDALQKFQEGLKDRVLTIFLDFAMKPVEQFFQEQLKGIMNSLFPKAAIEDTPQTRNTTALEQNTQAINANTAALTSGQAPAQQAQSWMTDVPDFGAVSGDALFSMGGRGAAAVNAPMAIDPLAFEGASDAVQGLNDSIYGMQFSLPSLGDSLKNVSDTVYKASDDAAEGGATLGQSLGKATSALGIAAGSIMGIAAGIGQIKKGGTANVLGGIGSILLGIGGGLGGFGKLFGWKGFATGGIASGGFRAFANGGMVTGPTLGLVGEGKYNEAIVPLPDGRSIPVQMQGSSSRELLAPPRSSSMASPMLSMSFQTTTINGVEYVDRAQLEQAMAETRKLAARDGASRGASLALDKLQNSPSTRRRVGIR